MHRQTMYSMLLHRFNKGNHLIINSIPRKSCIASNVL